MANGAVMPFDASQSFEVVQPPETEPRPTQPPDYVDPRVKAVMSIPTDTGRLAGINAAREAQLPPEAWAPWISTIHTESNWKLNAPDGAAGEIGPGQIKPGTGRMVGYSPDELRDAQTNLVASAKYFGQKWQQGDGDPVAAFTGYNSGSVRGKAGPDYVDKGIGRLDQWGYFGAPSKNPVQQAAFDPNQPFRVGTPSPKSSGSAPTSSGFDPNKPFEVQQQHSPSGERGPQYLPPNTYINMHQNPLPEAPMDEGNYVSKISSASPEDQADLRLSGELGAPVATTPGVTHVPTMADQVVTNGVPTPNTQTVPTQGDLTPGVAGTTHPETAVDRVAAEITRGASEGWNGTDTTILPEKVQARLDEAQRKGGLTGYLAALASTAAEDVKVPVAVWNAATSAFQKGIVQAGEEVGNYPSVPFGLGDVPAFARDVAALPEAFPAGGVEIGLHVVPEAASPRAPEAPNGIYDAMQQRANETPEQTAGRQARDQTEAEAAEREAAMANQPASAQAQIAAPPGETPPAPAEPTPSAPPPATPTGPAHDLALTELERIAAGRPAQPTPVPPAENPAMGELERIAAGQPSVPQAPLSAEPSATPLPKIAPTNEVSEPPSPPEVPGATTAYAPEPKEPMRLIPFLRQGIKVNPGTPQERIAQFGVTDPGGSIASIVGGPKGRPGLINNANGESLDRAGERAFQAGYFPQGRPDLNELRQAIEEDHGGNPVYSMHDLDAVTAYRQAIAHNDEIDRLSSQYGLPTRGLTRDQFFDQITDQMSMEDAAKEHATATAAHQDAFDKAVASARQSGVDPEAYTPRSLQEMEDEYRQADNAQAAGYSGANDVGRSLAGGNTSYGQNSAGSGGRGVGSVGRGGAESGQQAVDQAAEYRDELPGEGLFAGRPLPSMGEVITKGDLWKLPREELESMRDDESFSDHAKLVRALGGEDAAKEFNRLDRKQNSSNPDRADEGAREFDAKFGNLTPEQERLIYGTGETGPSVDDIEDVLKAHQTRSGDPEDAAYEAALAMRRVTPAEMMEVPTGQASSAAQSAYVRLRNAYEDMANAGLDSRQIENNILGALVRRGWKEGDAREVIGEFINQMGKLSGVNRLEAGRRLPAPPPTAGTDLFGTTRAQPTTRAPEPTIRTDARQTTLEGMEPSARQAQAASDAQGPRSNQQAANEGLFAPAATPQPELPVAPRTSRWPQTAGDNFRDLLNEIRTAGHQTAADFVLQRGVTTGHEHIAVVDNHTGEIVHAGTNNEVNKAGFRGDNGSTEVDRYTLHHNHPNSTALSGGDLMMLANPGISHVVAHGHDGTTTTASLSPKMAENRAAATSAIARNGEALRRASESAHVLSEHILVPLAKSGAITEEEGNRIYGDLANRLLDAQGLISYQSTVELPSEVRAAFGAALEKLGHGADVVDRSSGTVSAEDRIEGLPAPTREPEGTGNSARGSESTGLSDTQRTAGNVRGRGDTLLEGDERGIQAGLSAGEDRPQEQRAAILHNLRNGPLPPREMPNLIDQGPPRPIKQFQTAKGSVYQVHDDGTTTRNKSFHPEHGAADQGLKTRSERTIYVDPTVASELSGAGLNGLGPKGFRLALKDGKAWGLTWNNAADRWGVSPSAKEIPFETQPRVGLSPVEGWRKTNDVPGYEAYEGQHAGNAITGVSPAEPRASTAARGSESVLPLSEPPQPDNTPHGNEPLPPDSLWGSGSEPPAEPPRPPEIEAARITRPQAVKNLNVAENLTIMPQTLAALDEPSARLWNTWQNRARDETINAGQLRQVITPNFLKLSKPERLHVAGALEIARVEGEENLFANPDGTITAHNNAIPFARWSKVGDSLHLTPQETAAYHEAVQLGKDQWTMLMKGAARRYGWGGDIDPAVIREAANQHGDPGDYKKLNRLADLLNVMRQHEQDVYFPMQRFGSYFIAIRPKSGPDVAANLGGHPPLAWFETVEKPAFQDLFGVTNGKLSVQNVAAKRIAELQKQFPPDKFDIRQGDFVRTPGLLRQINIPAVEKLFMLMENKVRAAVQDQVMRGDNPPTTKSGVREEARNRYDELHGSTLEAFYDALFEELKSGYRRKANVVPGYSADFDRAVSSHLYQIARNSADMVHRDGIESAYQNIQDFHPHDNVKKYWKNWRAYQEDPGSALGRAAATMNQIGFTYMLGMNPSSTMIIASHMPMTAAPVLSVGVGPHVAVPAMIRGLKNAYGSLRFDSVHGAHIDLDKAMAGMPPEKQAFLRLMASEGRLAAVGTHDMAALNDKMAALFRGYADTARRGMEIATSNVHAVDQANRFAVASAAWDIANNPAHFNAAAAPLMRHNAIFRDMVQREMGLSRESYGRFMLSKAAFDWGKESHAPLMRGPLGQLMFALHGFQTRYLSTAFNLMKNGGPEGKFGFGLMMAALGLGAGALGLPFSEDAMKGADAVWHHFTGHDPDIMHKIHDAIQDTGMGQTGADMILHGPLSVLTGVNLGSRIGFGDVLSREFESSNALGTIPSIAWSAYSGASQRAESGQSPAAIAAEAAPGALRGPLRAYAETQQGVTSRRGVQQIAPEEISGTDLAKTSLGFQPLSVMRRQDEANRYYKAQGSQEGWAAMIKSGDTENAIKEMAAAGWGSGRIRGFIRQANQPPTVGKQFQRFEQNRAVAPPP